MNRVFTLSILKILKIRFLITALLMKIWVGESHTTNNYYIGNKIMVLRIISNDSQELFLWHFFYNIEISKVL